MILRARVAQQLLLLLRLNNINPSIRGEMLGQEKDGRNLATETILRNSRPKAKLVSLLFFAKLLYWLLDAFTSELVTLAFRFRWRRRKLFLLRRHLELLHSHD